VTVTLCVLLWAHEGEADQLIAYEDAVLDLLPLHRGRLLQRAQTAGEGDEPLEVQLIEFADEDAFDSFMHDDRRVALAEWRERAVARTHVLRVDLV
jgi:hypothetical protein